MSSRRPALHMYLREHELFTAIHRHLWVAHPPKRQTLVINSNSQMREREQFLQSAHGSWLCSSFVLFDSFSDTVPLSSERSPLRPTRRWSKPILCHIHHLLAHAPDVPMVCRDDGNNLERLFFSMSVGLRVTPDVRQRWNHCSEMSVRSRRMKRCPTDPAPAAVFCLGVCSLVVGRNRRLQTHRGQLAWKFEEPRDCGECDPICAGNDQNDTQRD